MDSKKYYFVPQENITTYELARLIPILIGGLSSGQGEPQDYNAQRYMSIHLADTIDELPEDLKRHFTLQKPGSTQL